MADRRRVRILYIKDFFEQYTDEEHAAGISEIINYLKKCHVEAERRSIIDDIDALNLYGMDIQLNEGGRQRLLLDREFELAEIRLLIDFVASSKSLPEEKSKKLIEKLFKYVSIHQRGQLKRQVAKYNCEKSKNKAILYNIDAIHGAIANLNHTEIEFQYYHYNMDKKLELKDNGKTYKVLPKRLYYDNNYCYFLASEDGEQKSFRVDKMTNVRVVNRDLNSTSEDYSTKRQALYEPVTTIEAKKQIVKILFKKNMMDEVIDYFGEAVDVEIVDEDHFRVITKIVPDSHFFLWIFGLGNNAMIEYPLSVAARMMDMLQERYKAYREGHSRNIYHYRRKKNKTDQDE